VQPHHGQASKDTLPCMGDGVMGSLSFKQVRAAGFPIYTLTRDEKLKALWGLLRFRRSHIIHHRIVSQSGMHGLALAWHYQPHAWSVRCGDMRTSMELFADDILPRALSSRMRKGKCDTQSRLRKVLRTYSGTQGVSNFRPTAAAAIYDRYLRDSGVVWDMSAGFGGRLLGASRPLRKEDAIPPKSAIARFGITLPQLRSALPHHATANPRRTMPVLNEVLPCLRKSTHSRHLSKRRLTMPLLLDSLKCCTMPLQNK
jgi:hypothetical protein